MLDASVVLTLIFYKCKGGMENEKNLDTCYVTCRRDEEWLEDHHATKEMNAHVFGLMET